MRIRDTRSNRVWTVCLTASDGNPVRTMGFDISSGRVSPLLATQATDAAEVSVSGGDGQTPLQGAGGDPQVILWDWGTLRGELALIWP